ncbi:hypothetical protein [Mycolicibacterium neoaurum]|uniref:hypothetical protein n=1 Tax=Mycolicibacterium neoaurum TaxID=1795 RepID=UPI001F4D1288|nr:hypothetical protein [Mycolicibacterium neoaurum]
MSTPEILLWDQAYNRCGDAKLPRAVVNVIRTYMNTNTLTGWVKAETLAEATGMQIRGVRKQIAANVAAGWLEVTESGNSSGKANTYRLTYPKGVQQDTIAAGDTPSKGVPQDTVTDPTKGVPQDTIDTEGCPIGPGKGVPQDTPTSPRTSPKRSSLREGTKVPDPFGGSDDRSNRSEADTTSESKGVPQDTVPSVRQPAKPRQAASASDDPFANQPARPTARHRPTLPVAAPHNPRDDPFAS